jgi:predicted dehydrogenase
MAKKIRVGIGGFGRSGCDIHAKWLREVPDMFEIVAVSDEQDERLAEAARDFKCKTFKDWRELLKKTKDMDLFVNALPSLWHSEGTVAALKAGFNTVCEKPVGLSVKEFDAMAAAAKRSGKLFAPFQNSRFYPFFVKIREIIDSGAIGKLVHVHSVWGGFSRRWDWQTLLKNGGGNLHNTGPHPMDHAIVLFGKKQPKVFCKMKAIQPFGGDADDFCRVALYGDGKDDPLVEILLSSYLAFPMGPQYNISGTLGGIESNMTEVKWKFFNPAKAPKQAMWKKWSNNRQYCSEALPWEECSWKREMPNSFSHNSKAFYDNIHAALTKGADLVVEPGEVRRQIIAMEECYRQNSMFV